MEGTHRTDDKGLLSPAFESLIDLLLLQPNGDSHRCLESLVDDGTDGFPLPCGHRWHSHIEDGHTDSIELPGDPDFLLCREEYPGRLFALSQGSIHKIDVRHDSPPHASSCRGRRACPRRDGWLSQGLDEGNRSLDTWPR